MNNFTFNFTEDKLKRCIPSNKSVSEVFKSLVEVLPKYGITSVERVAAFLAQCGHESNDFTVLQENLNYSTKGLGATFAKYFPTIELADGYARKPERIASRVYANRMGNGDEASKDGWKYRGRGAIQLTGKDNYTAFSKTIGKTLDETVAYCETLTGAIESACWFWTKNNLNAIADRKDILTLTKKINGGTIGLADRTLHYEKNLKILP